MKITKFLLGALLSVAGTQAFGFEGATSASDSLQQPQPGYVTVSHNEYNAMENRILNLETKLASFENSSLAAAANGTSCTSGGCTGNGGCTGTGGCCEHNCCKADCCSWMNTNCGTFAQADLVFLKAFVSEANEGGERYETGSRYTIGYMGECGSSLRLRYFEYSTTLAAGANNAQLEYLDTEYATRFCLGNVLRGELSAGTRWAQYDEEAGLEYNDTLGILVGLGLRGPSIRNWDTFLNLRYSQQFGHQNAAVGPAPTEDDGTFTITEMQLGLTRDFCLNCGTGFASVYVESQSWSGLYDADSEDLGLAGFGFSLGFRR
jgi:hypothetical protein